MKKFLLYLLILVFATSFCGLVFYLSRDDEYLNAESKAVYLNLGEEIEAEFDVENVKKSTKISIISSDENVVKIENNKIISVGKGTSVVSIKLTNARKKASTITQQIFVGDGSSAETPFYVRNEIDFVNIGSKYAIDKFFAQTQDIVLTKEFETIPGSFSGNYNGKGFNIIGYFAGGSKYSSSMFNEISENGVVCFLNFKDIKIDGIFNYASVVAVKNLGLIDYVSVSGVIENDSATGTCAGIVISNEGAAQIQRCVSKLNIKTAGSVIGGIAAVNKAVITSCQNGDTALSNPINCDFEFVNSELTNAFCGGIVAKNENVGETTIVSNNLSVNQIKIKDSVLLNGNYFGGIVGVDFNDGDTLSEYEIKKTNYIFGNYYLILSNEDVVKRGIGNITTTTPNNNGNLYIANGLTYDIFCSTENSILVSYATSFSSGKTSLTSWPTDVWVIDSSIFPQLVEMEKFGFVSSKLTVSLPRMFVGSEFEIPNADKFILYARTGIFTNPSNAGKVYSITGNLDFNGKDFIMVGTEETPVCVNFVGEFINGEYPIISNINISKTTSAIIDDSGEIKTVENSKNVGLFGVINNSTLTNLKIKNCKINNGTLENAENIGGIVGKSKNSKLVNCSNIAEKENGIYQGSVLATSNSLAVGGIVGFCEKSVIENCNVEVEVSAINKLNHQNNLYVGGIVGTLGNSEETFLSTQDYQTANVAHTQISSSSSINCKFNGNISANFNSKTISGGCVGLLNNGANVLGFKSNNATISSNNAGGIAGDVKGIVEQSSSKTTIKANYAGGFACNLIQDSSRVYNCYCETTFTNENAIINAGIAAEVSDKCLISQCVNYNNFKNSASATKNFSKIGKDVKFDFDCNGKISELNFFNATDSRNVILHNCFYVNQVDDENSNDFTKTRFYSQTGEYPTFEWLYNFVDAKVILVKTYNGTVRNGRMLSTGGLVNNDLQTSSTWNDFYFLSSIWKNADKMIVSSNLLNF